MQIGNSWVEISSKGVLIQKSSFGVITLCYATNTPTTEETFVLSKNIPTIYPASLDAKKKLYAKSFKGTKNITVNELEDVNGAESLGVSVAKGKLYSIVVDKQLNQDELVDLCVTTGSEVVTVSSISIGTTSLQSEVQLREGSAFTIFSGTTLVSTNRNRNFKAIALPITNGEQDPTITDEGLLVEEFTMFGVAGQGVNSLAFTSGDLPVPYTLEPSTSYTIRITNKENSVRDFRVTLYITTNIDLTI